MIKLTIGNNEQSFYRVSVYDNDYELKPRPCFFFQIWYRNRELMEWTRASVSDGEHPKKKKRNKILQKKVQKNPSGIRQR